MLTKWLQLEGLVYIKPLEKYCILNENLHASLSCIVYVKHDLYQVAKKHTEQSNFQDFALINSYLFFHLAG